VKGNKKRQAPALCGPARRRTLAGMEVKVVNCPSQDLALTNCLFISPRAFGVLGGDPSAGLQVEVNGLVYLTKPNEKVEAEGVGMNSIQRRGLGVSLGDVVTISVFPPGSTELLSSAALEIDFVVKAKAARGVENIDGGVLSSSILGRYANQILTTGQSFAIEFQGQNLLLKVGPLEALVIDKGGAESAGDGDRVGRGMVTSQTQLVLSKAQGSPIVLTGLETQSRKTIFKQDFSFADMGIGGLDKEFSDIFRRAFASRW
jgi:vesicle-fusing ATPase